MKLVGWVDMGDESFHLECIKNKEVKRKLATECLQIIFLGHTGFRFPIAHFSTEGVKASGLMIHIWDAVSKLQDWGFTVDCILQDGGDQNREFAKGLFPPGQMLTRRCLLTNVCNTQRQLVISQDFSHVGKKIRNGLMSSGIQTHCS